VKTLQQLIQEKLPLLKVLPSKSPIICFQLASAKDAITVGKQLKDAGIFAPAIRPPTVPTSRIRISLMATHTLAHLERLVEVLGEIHSLK
ncbi:MAG: aminotransferase class I/II-fold pyridoxal phosphate-dependent enzyme, partial [Coleofasciculaceae cyanobacterium]